jgi:hypothetical protein
MSLHRLEGFVQSDFPCALRDSSPLVGFDNLNDQCHYLIASITWGCDPLGSRELDLSRIHNLLTH